MEALSASGIPATDPSVTTNVCPICFDEKLEEGPLAGRVLLPTLNCCYQTFHLSCIIAASATKSECPSCRVKIKDLLPYYTFSLLSGSLDETTDSRMQRIARVFGITITFEQFSRKSPDEQKALLIERFFGYKGKIHQEDQQRFVDFVLKGLSVIEDQRTLITPNQWTLPWDMPPSAKRDAVLEKLFRMAYFLEDDSVGDNETKQMRYMAFHKVNVEKNLTLQSQFRKEFKDLISAIKAYQGESLRQTEAEYNATHTDDESDGESGDPIDRGQRPDFVTSEEWVQGLIAEAQRDPTNFNARLGLMNYLIEQRAAGGQFNFDQFELDFDPGVIEIRGGQVFERRRITCTRCIERFGKLLEFFYKSGLWLYALALCLLYCISLAI